MTTPIWDSNPSTPFPSLKGELRADACVVGLGGSGLAAVHELRAMGKSVIGLDAASVGGGAAGRNGGFLLGGIADFHHDAVAGLGRERATLLYRLTLAELERMRLETPELIRVTGSLRISHDDEELRDCEAQYDEMRIDGLSVERYEGPEGRGLLFPDDGVFQPLERCRELARRVASRGSRVTGRESRVTGHGSQVASHESRDPRPETRDPRRVTCDLFENSRATSISGSRVETADGAVRCDRVIVAVDGSLERVLPELAGRVRTARLQMLGTAPAPDVTFSRPVYYRYGFEYWQQLPGGSIALGGFRDAAGGAEWTSSTDPTDGVQRLLDRFLVERLGVRTSVTHRWAASVAYTETGLPIVEEVRPRVWAVGGYCGTGNVLGSICGRAAARAAFGERTAAMDAVRSA
jgi:glycine/D-amino acid oxidase-like deaminating enzyme